MTIRNKILSLDFLSGLIFAVSIYTFFITVFFFTYGSYIEKKAVTNNVSILMDDVFDDINISNVFINGLPDIIIGNNTPFSINIPLPSSIKPDHTDDDKINTENKQLIDKSVKIIGICFAIAMFMSCAIWYIKYRSMAGFYNSVIKKNILVLLIVIGTELMYFTFISKNYRSVDYNNTKKMFLQHLKDKLNE